MNLPKMAEGTALFLSRPLSLFGMALDASMSVGEVTFGSVRDAAGAARSVVTSYTDHLGWTMLGFQKRLEPSNTCPLGCPHRAE